MEWVLLGIYWTYNTVKMNKKPKPNLKAIFNGSDLKRIAIGRLFYYF